MISKEKLRQRIAPQKPERHALTAELNVIHWKIDSLLNIAHNLNANDHIIRGLAQHLGLRSY